MILSKTPIRFAPEKRVKPHDHLKMVVADSDGFDRFKADKTGQLLVDALKASPHRGPKIEPRRAVMPVRAVKL
jgi:hypothetical protein